MKKPYRAERTRSAGHGAVFTLLALLIMGCEPPPRESLPPRPVKAQQVQLAAPQDIQQFHGTLTGVRETPVSFQVAGKILERRVHRGQLVSRSQTLMRLDPTDFELDILRLNAELQAAQAEQRRARLDRDRIRELAGREFVSPTDRDRANAEFDAATARVAVIQAERRLADRKLQYTEVQADYDGWFDSPRAEVGQIVAAGEPLGRLISRELQAIFDLPEQQVALLRTGDRLRATFWGCSSCATEAEVREISATAAPTSGTLVVLARLSNASDLLRPGMSVSLTTSTRLPADTLSIPLTAIVQRDGHPAVWVVEDQGSVTLRPVRLVGSRTGQALVGSGLREAEWVVTAGQHDLMERQAVRILR